MTSVLQLDNVDDRTEVRHALLRRLSPARRVAFLAWACGQSKLGKFESRPVVGKQTHELAKLARWDSSADEALSKDVELSLWTLAVQFQLNLDLALAKLVEMVRKPPT